MSNVRWFTICRRKTNPPPRLDPRSNQMFHREFLRIRMIRQMLGEYACFGHTLGVEGGGGGDARNITRLVRAFTLIALRCSSREVIRAYLQPGTLVRGIFYRSHGAVQIFVNIFMREIGGRNVLYREPLFFLFLTFKYLYLSLSLL